MGKPYSKELANLSATYEWSMRFDVDHLARAISASASYPLLAIGSGGSFTVAHFAASLHQKYSGQIAKPVTPLELAASTLNTREVAILLLSAGGANKDIIGAFHYAVEGEPRSLAILSGSSDSPLARLAQSYRYVDSIMCDLPSGRDGFLATNSLLAFAILLYRAWATAFNFKPNLPNKLEGLIDDALVLKILSECAPVWQKENLNVLYGPTAHSAALDLESKFTEAALGAVQIADYRNFAHGRHHWLAKRADTTGVLAFLTKDDENIARRTLRQIPETIPLSRIQIPQSGTEASIACLIAGLYIAGAAGQARHIDPGRPGVPQFGSNIYRLNAFSRRTSAEPISATERVAIERKSGETITVLRERGEIDSWRAAYGTFTDKLRQEQFNGIVLDYDGTLCDSGDRFRGLSEGVLEPLIRILSLGMIVGIATGRGSSVRNVLRKAIPEEYWQQILVGYYNGAENGLLSDDRYPAPNQDLCKDLRRVIGVLESDPVWPLLEGISSKIKYKQKQITFQMGHPNTLLTSVWTNLKQALHGLDICGVEVLCSTHSIDIVAPGVSKDVTVKRVQEIIGGTKDFPVLCIGDRGQWPGNDFALLNRTHSLSVDEVSRDPNSCWNLAPPGHRGVQATIGYLRAFDGTSKGGAKFVFRQQRKGTGA